jgi:hypothetical protein
MKLCTCCNIEKELQCFYNDKSRADEKHPHCKECKSSSDKKYRNANLEKRREADRKYAAQNTDKAIARAKSWYQSNTDRAKESRKNWYESNKDKVDISRKAWYEQNADKMKTYHNDYGKERYATNMHYRIKSILNARLRACVRTRSTNTSEYLGCPIEFFIQWIESQFTSEMDWNNMGSDWHFDHVKPCASFNFDNSDDIFKCYNWSNIRPLMAKDNCNKGSKIFPILIDEQATRAKEFEAMYTHKKSIDVPS